MLGFNDNVSQNVVRTFDVYLKFSKFGDRFEEFNTEIKDEEFGNLFFTASFFEKFDAVFKGRGRIKNSSVPSKNNPQRKRHRKSIS